MGGVVGVNLNLSNSKAPNTLTPPPGGPGGGGGGGGGEGRGSVTMTPAQLSASMVQISKIKLPPGTCFTEYGAKVLDNLKKKNKYFT